MATPNKRASAKRTTAKRATAKRASTKRASAKRTTAARPAGKLSARDAALKVLTDSGKAMTVKEIADAALPLTALKGATPKQTFYSLLYAENRKADGLFKKVGDKGTFKLNPKRKTK